MYQWRKGIASWKIGDTLYISVVFSWDVPAAAQQAREHKGKVIVGGPAAVLNTISFAGIADVRETSDGIEPILFHNPLASYSTRGCVRKCSFCAVSKIEPEFVELPNFRPAPVMCDNNFLAASVRHQEHVISRLSSFRQVDFNQGLDARLFTPTAAERLSRLRLKARFAFDHINEETAVHDAVSLCRSQTTKDIGVYVLIGYNDTPEEALYRLHLVKSWGIRPNPMRYQPLDTQKRNNYIAQGWTEEELLRMMKYWSRLRWYEHIPYEEFRAEELPLFSKLVMR